MAQIIDEARKTNIGISEFYVRKREDNPVFLAITENNLKPITTSAVLEPKQVDALIEALRKYQKLRREPTLGVIAGQPYFLLLTGRKCNEVTAVSARHNDLIKPCATCPP